MESIRTSHNLGEELPFLKSKGSTRWYGLPNIDGH